MVWFIAGLLSAFLVVALVFALKVRRWRRTRGRPGAGRRYLLRRLTAELDTDPEQEATLLEALDALAQVAQDVRAELKGSRGDVAALLRDDALDTARVDALVAQHRPGLERLQDALRAAFTRIHAALDPGQRDKLAAVLERGWAGPGRGCARA